MQIDNRRALVVGGSGGIGREIADLFAQSGASVVVADRAAAPDGSHKHVGIDVTDEASVRRAIAEAREILGGDIEILVNSAGILSQCYAEEMTLEEWRRTIDVDLTGVFLVSREVVGPMAAQGWGRIINIASQLGIKGAPMMTHYAAAKAGVIAFTKSLALEVSGRGVLVNAIAPGPIDTQLSSDLDPEWRAKKISELPIGRFGKPAEVAPSALLLASEPGGNLYTGQTLGPNSGDVMQ
ncbi:SDR family NAD(P)-dependent oxidoreductase [Paenarthrobacter sp. NPDC089675]|uniref:SDR family NAD(P)-dependent oxidoreductase n=1 Tax=Paenarthrobacter sp. NPDC089675 TaxID=3364376 RepID=UPI003813444F